MILIQTLKLNGTTNEDGYDMRRISRLLIIVGGLFHAVICSLACIVQTIPVGDERVQSRLDFRSHHSPVKR